MLIFIFGALFMLLTTLTFLLGAPMEKFVCQTITDPSLTEMEKVTNRNEQPIKQM